MDRISLSTTGGAQACVLVGVGNTLAELRTADVAGGRNLIHFPGSPEDYAASDELAGNPLLFPWANRLANRAGYSFAGRRVAFPTEGPPAYLRDNNRLPLHGLLTKSPDWQSVCSEAHTHLARHEWHPDSPGYACYPFGHVLEMRHTLRDLSDARGVGVRIELCVKNTGRTALPLAFGFHPYFAGGTAAREQTMLDLPLSSYIRTDARLIPDGTLQALEEFWPDHRSLALRPDLHVDHGFTGLMRDVSSGLALPLVLRTPDRELAVHFGATFRVAVVYAPIPPADHDEFFVCLEPMLAPTNALGDPPPGGAEGAWPGVQALAAGERFRASFEIQARSPGAN